MNPKGGYVHSKVIDADGSEEKEDHVVFHATCPYCGKKWTYTGPLLK